MSASNSAMTLDADRVDELHKALMQLVDNWSNDASLCDADEPDVAELIRGMTVSLAGVVRLYEVGKAESSTRKDGAT